MAPAPSGGPPPAVAPAREPTAAGLRPVFARRFGGAAFEPVNQLAPIDVAVDREGAILVAGAFRGAIDLGAGPLVSAGATDFFLAKLDRTGTPIWGHRFGGPGNDAFSGLSVDGAGNVALAGVVFGPIDFGGGPIGGSSTIVVAKFTGAGDLLWQRAYGTPDEIQFAYGVAADPFGNVVLSGRSDVPIAIGTLVLPTRRTPFLAKLGADGDPLWGKAFGGHPDQAITAVRTDLAGNVFFAGEHEGAVVDGVELPRVGELDLYAGRFGRDGAHHWVKSYGDGELTRMEIATTLGDVFVSGPLRGTVDFGGEPLGAGERLDASFLARLGPDGLARWARVVRGHGKLASDRGNLFLAGTFSGSVDLGAGPISSAGERDIVIGHFDARTGELRHASAYGDAAAQLLGDAEIDPAGGLVVAGTFAGNLDFGGVTLASTSNSDLFIAKLARPIR